MRHPLQFLLAGTSLIWAAAASAQTYTLFQVPGAIATSATCINSQADTAGVWTDSKNLQHGFIRNADGSFVTFDAPGTSTEVLGINDEGSTVGIYLNAATVLTPFLRTPEGVFTSLTVPDAVSAGAIAITAAGQIGGGYQNEKGVGRIFVRGVGGTYTTFTVAPETYVRAMNNYAVVTGSYYDLANKEHGFLRSAEGPLVSFDMPNSSLTAATTINDGNTIGGIFVSSKNGGTYSFLRSEGGLFIGFGVTGSMDTEVTGLNASGTAVGRYIYPPNSGSPHGFARSLSGVITVFDAPGSTLTSPAAINESGVITGSYVDSKAIVGSFILQP